MRVESILAAFLVAVGSVPASEGLRLLERPGLRVVYADERLHTRAAEVAEQVPSLLLEQSGALGIPPPPRVTVSLVSTPPANPQQRRALGLEGMPPWAAGLARGGRAFIAVRLDRLGPYPDRDLSSVLAHEVAHVMLDRALGPEQVWMVPRWFHEGYAMTEAHRVSWSYRWEMGRSLFFAGPIPLDWLTREWPEDRPTARAAYAQTFSFLNYVIRRTHRDAAREVVRRVARGEGFHAAWRAVTGGSPEEWERRWRRSVTMRYRWIPALTSGGTLWLLISLLFVIAFLRKRRRSRSVLERWEEEERFLEP